MTVRTKVPDVPSQLPPARLFLDDIEEIVRILREIIESEKPNSYSSGPDRLRVKFEIGNKECDDLQDLPRLTRSMRTNRLDITVGRELPATSLRFDYVSSRLVPYGLSQENSWQAFRKVEAVLKERCSRWRTFVHLIPLWLLVALAGFLPLPLFSLLGFLLKQTMPATSASVISLVLVIGLWTSLTMGFVFHTTIILRHSHEPSPLRQGLRDKLPATLIGAALGATLTFFLTMLGLYIKHKYWP